MKAKLPIPPLFAAAAFTVRSDADNAQQAKLSAGFLITGTSLRWLKACRDNLGIGKTPKCVNANEARDQATIQEMRNALR